MKVYLFFLLFLSISCIQSKQKTEKEENYPAKKEITLKIKEEVKKPLYLDNKNAIPFLYEYGKNNPENKIRIITKYGNIDILLYENTKYNRANFIYLTKINYFENRYKNQKEYLEDSQLLNGILIMMSGRRYLTNGYSIIMYIFNSTNVDKDC